MCGCSRFESCEGKEGQSGLVLLGCSYFLPRGRIILRSQWHSKKDAFSPFLQFESSRVESHPVSFTSYSLSVWTSSHLSIYLSIYTYIHTCLIHTLTISPYMKGKIKVHIHPSIYKKNPQRAYPLSYSTPKPTKKRGKKCNAPSDLSEKAVRYPNCNLSKRSKATKPPS